MVNGGSDEGPTSTENYNVLERHGAATWAEFPYDTNFKAWCLDTAAWRHALAVRTEPVQYLRDASDGAGLDLLKQLLTDGYVIVFGTYISSWQSPADRERSLDRPPTTRRWAMPSATGSTAADGGHAMTIVGYNDAVWTDINGNGDHRHGREGRLPHRQFLGHRLERGRLHLAGLRRPAAVPAVPGAPTTPREPAFFNDQVFLLTTRDSYSPLMIGEFTVNHAKRDQMRLSLGLSTLRPRSPRPRGRRRPS